MLNKLLKNPTVQNAGWMILGKIAQMLVSLLVGLLTARYLGPSNYGIINYANAYTAFFMAFCTLGMDSILVRELLNQPQREGEILGSSLLLRLISSAMSVVVIVCMVGILDAGEPTTLVVTALCSLSLMFRVFETFRYWFQSRLRSKVTALVTLAAYIITSIYKVILLIYGKSVAWFAFATTLDYLCVAAFLWICYRAEGGQKLSYSWEMSRQLLSRSVHFILPSLMVSIYAYADKVMIKQMMDTGEVGYYATASTLCGMWCFVLSAIIDSVTPSIMQAYKCDKVLFEKRNRQLYATVFYVSVSVSVLLCLLAKPVVWLLYGEAYLPAAAPMRVITWYTTFSYLGVARNAWIVCEEKQKYLKYIYVSAALGNVLMNFLLIPLWGATGAALASLLTQMLTTMVLPFFIREIRRNSVLMVEAICLKGIR